MSDFEKMKYEGYAAAMERQSRMENAREMFNSPEWKERWNTRGLTNSYEAVGENNPNAYKEYNAFNGERHRNLLRDIADRKVEKNPYKGGLLGGIAGAMSNTAYEFPREFHNDRVDEIHEALKSPENWQKHLEGRPIFPPGMQRDIYRDPYGTKEKLPGLLGTFVDSLK